jgi:preprotein translocase subunit SecA
VRHEVLNAKQHTREAEIVAQAGRLHSVTVATNMAGRGVDIILGGNAEALAKREVRAEELDPDDGTDGTARFEELFAKHKAETTAEGERVRELGGLYVLGTERHESRRIDNQLRGRSGRQGDPGESRFYLSLEDELMRLFATGAMDWVMGKSLPDDVPIESKMVSKAIERAQTTVEQRNAEIRKNVLKYDEVMSEQRRVIYARREQILAGADLRTGAMEYLAEAVDGAIATFCVSDFSEEWDLEGLVAEVRTLWPSRLDVTALADSEGTDELYDRLMAEAVAHYEAREAEAGDDLMRRLEREVMLRIIDQRWREHLADMDYLRDGINLRAMGQKDPLNEWQREGFEMFSAMMSGIARDFVRYLMHIEVKVERPAEKEAPALRDVRYSAPEDPVEGAKGMARSVPDGAPTNGAGEAASGPTEEPANVPVTKSDWDKTGRNEPCPCGSGKKYKLCHGR